MSLVDPIAAVYARVSPDATLQGLLGTKDSGRARVYPEWPDETLVAEDYPRVTLGLGGLRRDGSTLYVAEVNADIWAWPTGANGGGARILAVDQRLLDLLDGPDTAASPGLPWAFGAARIFSREVGARDFPTEPGTPLRRRRTFRLTIS